MDFIFYKEYEQYEVFTAGFFRRYWKAFYTGIYLLGDGEVCPRTTFELAFASVIMILSAMLNANIFGNMAVLV